MDATTRHFDALVEATYARRRPALAEQVVASNALLVRLEASARLHRTWRWRLRRIIVRAAPTCTLWRYGGWNVDCLEFVFWPRWKISGLELMQYG